MIGVYIYLHIYTHWNLYTKILPVAISEDDTTGGFLIIYIFLILKTINMYYFCDKKWSFRTKNQENKSAK